MKASSTNPVAGRHTENGEKTDKAQDYDLQPLSDEITTVCDQIPKVIKYVCNIQKLTV